MMMKPREHQYHILQNVPNCLTNQFPGLIINIAGLVQERRNSIANALELRLSCTNP